jgi:hypothetical protein
MPTFEPCRVDPPALLRWLQEGAKLILHHPLPWTGAALLTGLLAVAVARSRFTVMLVAATSYVLLVVLANRLDRPAKSRPETGTLTGRSWRIALSYGAVMAVGLGLGSIVFRMHDGDWSTFWYAPGDGPNAFRWGVDTALAMLSLIATITVMTMGVAAWGPRSSLFAFHLAAVMGLDWRAAVALSEQGTERNRMSVTLLVFVPVLLLGPIIVVLPALGPLFQCFLAAVSYAVFRDILLNVARSQPQPARAMSAAANVTHG